MTGGLWAYHDHQLRSGREIALRAVPVDPRDVLRGDYVTLRYEISRARRTTEEPPWPFRRNEVVFVSLEPAGDDWALGAVERVPPREGLFLRARVASVRERRLELVYGIESFFVEEGAGREYEEARNHRRLWAIARVSPSGVARLERLEIR